MADTQLAHWLEAQRTRNRSLRRLLFAQAALVALLLAALVVKLL